jgi:aminomethyltransferase
MKKTKFYTSHEKTGAKIVEFAGYLMPIQYTSIISEHKAVRNSVGVFDVSHMGEVFIRGEKAADYVQYLTTNDVSKLYPGRVQYSSMCYHDGGIVDDLLVYMISPEEFLLVINASNVEKDENWMKENNNFGVEIDNQSEEFSLLAIQGPDSQKTLQKITDRNLDLEYYHFFKAAVNGKEMIVSRTGYTGELGYEIYFKGTEKDAEEIWDAVFEAGRQYNIQPVGLAARDSLRLEMGFCLYGNDIDKTTNPLEAGLGWITKLNKGDFIGKQAILSAKSEGLKRRLTPLISDEKVFPRHGYDITIDGKKIGTVTSGTVSPVLDKPIAMAYIESGYVSEGNRVNFNVRGKEIPAVITKLPFISK